MNALAAVAPGAEAITVVLWIGGGFIVFAVLLVGVLALVLRKRDVMLGTIVVPGALSFWLGVIVVTIGLAGEGAHARVLDENRVADAISDQYRITSIEFANEDEQRQPRKTELCTSVTPDSPEYVGVADGQQIRFKAGSTNCTSPHPKVTIIVTHTPGTALSADDLRKNNPTEEP